MFLKKQYQGIILIDIHDVLNDLHDFKVKQGLIYAKKYGYKLVNPNTFDTQEMFNWPKEVDDSFWKLYLPQFLNGIGAKELAPEALYKLSQEHYKIILYNHPKYFELNVEMQEYWRKHIEHWFNRYHITYDTYLASTQDLLEIARNYNVTLFISANPESIEHMASSYPTIIFDTNYNQGLDGVHINRVRGWKEAYQKIKTKDLT